MPIINNFSFFIALAGTVLALVGTFVTGKKRRGTAFTVIGLVLNLDSGKLKPGGTITGNVYFEDDATKVYYYSNMLQGESDVCWIIQL